MKKNIAPITLTLALTLITACGKGDGGGSSDSSMPVVQEQTAPGSYRAILRPMNNQLSGFIPTGIAEIKISDDTVQVKTLLDDDARVAHMQSVHMGTRCPTVEADTNKDGIVDVQEAMRFSGQVLIPLDGDLSSEAAGEDVYPVGRGFTYNKTVSLSALQSDVKARVGQNLNLAGRVVIIHGVANQTKMPATVATIDDLTPQSSVPVTCGILQRVPER